jgi:hypothetical protein
MAEILGKANINKLSNPNVFVLLNHASDKEKMLKILGQNNIDKLTGQSVSYLLASASDTEKMAEILGSENINKLDGENVKHVLNFSKKEMKQLLKSYYTGTNQEVISLLE